MAKVELSFEERMQEEIAQRSRDQAEWVLDSLTMMSPSPAHPVRDGWYDGWARAPEEECEHGRLEGDKTDPCGCYQAEMSSQNGR